MTKVLVRRVKIRRPHRPVVKKHKTGMLFKDEEIVQSFSPRILELGDLSKPCNEIEAIAAIFDLSGFTRFCNQVDS